MALVHARRMYWPRGKVLGGSSSIYAMCYCRGHRKDYDSWQQEGATGWGSSDVLPYFIKAEDQQNGACEYHGTGGPLSVQNLRYTNPLSGVFIDAAVQAGHPRTDDFNGAQQRGFDYYQVILAGGAINSPQLLMLSGIGPADHLRSEAGKPR